MELQRQQQAAYDAIISFLNDRTKHIFILKGYAGTGKTTLVASLVNYLLENHLGFYLMAPTGKAAKVLANKTGCEATTIHKGIYQSAHYEVVNADNVDDSEVVYKFPLRFDNSSEKICIVDEASMVSSIDIKDVVFQFGSGNIMNDLLEFADTYHGGKLIFIGDPAQLPPVGDKNSEALREKFFTEKGYCVESCELTDVLRQDKDSMILQNAMQVREILRLNKTNTIDFGTNNTDFAEVSETELLDMYCTDFNGIENGDSVMLTYSNAEAALLNRQIRSKVVGKEELQPGETLMVVNNNYGINECGNGLMNGNMVKTISVNPDVEIVDSFANIHEGGKRKIVPIRLVFRNVTLSDEEANVFSCKIVDSLLKSDAPSMTYLERQALFIHFVKSHPKLKIGTADFFAEWRHNPYVNAVQVKYGYAITVHKSQGSEWNTVYLNYRNANTSEECLRWIYTATTRATKSVLAYNVPHIKPTSKIRVADVVTLRNAPEGWGQDSNDSLKKKYLQVASSLEGTPYKIDSVQHKPYREIFIISGERFDTCYSGKFVFRDFTASGTSTSSAEILKLINSSSASKVADGVPAACQYEPSEEVFRTIWDILKPIFAKAEVAVKGVVENKEQYYVQYNILTSGQFACLKVYFNDKQFITYVAPGSNIGTADMKLNKTIELLEVL